MFFPLLLQSLDCPRALILPGLGIIVALESIFGNSGAIGPFGPFGKLVVGIVGLLNIFATFASAISLFFSSACDLLPTIRILPA
jgi:hypothetical protein